MKSKSIIWILTFVTGVTTTLIASFLFLSTLTRPNSPNLPTPQVLGISSQATMPGADAVGQISSAVYSSDARPVIIQQYLNRYNSPLTPLAKQIVEVSDKYHLDYRILVAIARQESALCKIIPENSYNCWGFGIYGDKVTRFDSYSEGIEIVAKTLKKNYIDKGLTTPEKIMAKYTPPSIEKGGPWARGVNSFMEELQ